MAVAGGQHQGLGSGGEVEIDQPAQAVEINITTLRERRLERWDGTRQSLPHFDWAAVVSWGTWVKFAVGWLESASAA